MRSYVNNGVTGTDARATWEGRQQKVHEEMQFYDTPSLKWSQGPRGVRANVQFPYVPNPAQVIYGRPFLIYQETDTTSTDAQKKVYTDLGLDINDYTYQIRSGIIGARSKFVDPTQNDSQAAFYVSGNFESQIWVPCTDYMGFLGSAGGGNGDNGSSGQFDDPLMPNDIEGLQTGIILDSTADTVLSSNMAGVFCTQIFLNPLADAFGDAAAGFWLNVADNQNPVGGADPGLTVELWGRMFTFDTFEARSQQPFPYGQNIIPLGCCMRHVPTGLDTRLEFNQEQQSAWGNVVNRYPPGGPIWRGRWVTNALVNQYFFPNDEVFDDSAGSTGGVGWGRYTFIGAVPARETQAPHMAASGNWIKTSN